MQLVTTLLTIVGSGIAAALMTYSLNSRKEQIFFMRKKAEDLYLSADRFEKMVGTYFLRGLMLLQGDLSPKSLVELQTKEEPPEYRDAHLSMIMTIQIYFPDVETHYEKMYDTRGKLQKFISAGQKQVNSNMIGDAEALKKYNLLLDIFYADAKSLKIAIIAEGRKLSAPSALWPERLTGAYYATHYKRLSDEVRARMRAKR